MAGENSEMDKRQQLEELKYIQKFYQNQYAVVNNSVNMTLQDLQELNSAQKTLESAELLKGKELITCVGGDFYAFSAIKNPSTFLVAVGANYLVEKDVDSSKTHVANLIQKKNENLNRLMKSKKEVEAALIEVNYRVDNML